MAIRHCAIIPALLLAAGAVAFGQPLEPHQPGERTLLLDRFDTPFEPDGALMTAPEVITPAGEHTGGRPMAGGEFVDGRFGKAYRFHGKTAMYYPAAGNIDLSAGSVSFWLQLGFEPQHPNLMPSEMRNQLYFHVDPPGSAIMSVYTTMKALCVGVWDGGRQLVAYIGPSIDWHEGEWHHVEVRWGRKLELWIDGEQRATKDWIGLFGPMSVDLAETQMYVGSRVRYSDVVSEFAIDELVVLGPGGEQVPPYPRLTCPRIAAPAIDGTLSEGEWAGAGATTGFVGLNENALVVDQSSVYVGHDEEKLYVAFDCRDPLNRPLEGSHTDRDAAVYHEDAVDIILAPGPGTYPYYQLASNVIGTKFDMRLYEEGGRREKEIDWNPDWVVGTSKEEGRWVMEAAIPFADLGGRGAPMDGETWRVNFCRDADAAARLSSWAYTSGNFHRTSNYGEMLFRTDDRAMRLNRLEGAAEGDLAAELELAGRAFDPPVTVTAELIDDNLQTVAEATKELIDNKFFLFEPPPLVSGAYALSLTAATAESVMYYQRIPFEVMKAYDISVAGYPYEGKLWVTANIGGLPNAPEGVVARAKLMRGEAEVGACEITQFARGIGEGSIEIGELAPGQYMVISQAVAPDGAVLGEADAAYEHFEKPVFWRSDAGKEPTVPVPWTPVEVGEGGVRVWGREYRHAGRALPEQIVNQGAEILAGPVRLNATVGGQQTDLAALALTEDGTREVDARHHAEGEAGALGARIDLTTEFDGLQRYDLTLTPRGEATLEGLVLEVPVKREFASFLLPSSGRFSAARTIEEGPWSSAFMPQVWLGNDDVGLAWFAESDRYWEPKDEAGMLEVVAEGDVVVMRANMVRSPVAVTEPITITFGLMATPVKSVPVGDPWFYRFASPTNAIDLGDPEKSVIFYNERLEYPGEGNVDPRQGTLEFWLSNGGVRGSSIRDVMSIEGEGGALRLQYHDANAGRWVLSAAGAEGPLLDVTGIGLPPEGFAHVALTWGPDAIALYVNGALAGAFDGPIPGADQMAAAPEKLRLVFGCHHQYRGYTDIAVDEIRVSDVQRYSGDACAVPEAICPRDEHTLLLDHLDDRFTPDGADAETRPEIISGLSGELGGMPSIGSEFVEGKFGSAVGLPHRRARPCSEMYREVWNANAYLLWSWMPPEQRDEHGWPLPLFVEPEHDLVGMNEAFDEVGVRVCTYTGYMGIGAPSRWSRQFGHEWRREPVSSQPSEPPKGHMFLDCCGRSEGYGDYMAAGSEWLITQHGFDGIYTDGNGHCYPCTNRHHGCGYIDREGRLRPTFPVFGTREYLKRMYRIAHEGNPDGYLVNHVSYNTFIPTMSFTDVYYTGEHENYEDLLKCRVRWQAKPWGIWPILLGGDSHSYEPLHTMYGLLHGVGIWTQGATGRNDAQRKAVNLWTTYDEFGYREAEWVPWFAAEERGLARPAAQDVKCSLYLREGERALLIVGNTRHEAVETQVAVNLAQMGLEEENARAYDALSDREVPLAGGKLQVRVRPTSFVLVRIDRE